MKRLIPALLLLLALCACAGPESAVESAPADYVHVEEIARAVLDSQPDPAGLETLEGEEAPQITARLWRGPLAMEFSEILDTARFPVSQEGLEAVTAWLEAQAAKLNGE